MNNNPVNMSSDATVRRITLFKVPDVKHQEELLERYRTMPQEAFKVCHTRQSMVSKTNLLDSKDKAPSRRNNTDSQQDGKPYIVSVAAGKTFQDQRNQGYTVAVVTEFRDLHDFRYYDTECAAHARLRAFTKTVNHGFLVLFYQNWF